MSDNRLARGGDIAKVLAATPALEGGERLVFIEIESTGSLFIARAVRSQHGHVVITINPEPVNPGVVMTDSMLVAKGA